ncbi:hypothetical protein [Nocardia sp. NBC_00403]|uniref:hypothetical protein n=1 Tax=Nocardia sp. NBC_00403 TaxID=2975990 RepID=UPI002E1DBD68
MRSDGQAQQGDRPSSRLTSAYWRGLSFLPYQAGDHAEVARMLDLAEDSAVQAVNEAEPGQLLVALENLHPVLETRGRAAWDAGELESAESYYR